MKLFSLPASKNPVNINNSRAEKLTTLSAMQDRFKQRAAVDLNKTRHGLNQGRQLIQRHWQEDPKTLKTALTNPALQKRVKQGLAATSAAVVIANVQQAPANASPDLLKMLNPFIPLAEQVLHANDKAAQTHAHKHLPDVPAITDSSKVNTAVENLMVNLIRKNNGLSIGESHTNILNKTMLANNISRLKQAGVNRIFAEMFGFDKNLELDTYCYTGQGLDKIKEKMAAQVNANTGLWNVPASQQKQVAQNFINAWGNLIEASQKQGVCTVGINSAIEQLNAIGSSAIQTRNQKGNVEDLVKNGIVNYVNGANKRWATNIKDYYKFHPEAKNGKFIVINGAAHNANSNGLDNQLNVPSIFFSPQSSEVKPTLTKVDKDVSVDLREIDNLDQDFGNDYVFKFPK